MPTLYTIGWTRKTLRAFVTQLREAHVDALIDVRLDRSAVRPDVEHASTACDQGLGDEKMAMAAPVVTLAAHHSRPLRPRQLQ